MKRKNRKPEIITQDKIIYELSDEEKRTFVIGNDTSYGNIVIQTRLSRILHYNDKNDSFN